jgi:hypothetical protein
MAYHVKVDEGRLVLGYLLDPDRNLTESDSERVLHFLEVELAECSEEYRNERRLSPGSPDFEVTLLFWDSAGRWRHFRFIVSDSSAGYGVLWVRLAEEL